jgi:hypothetical protein
MSRKSKVLSEEEIDDLVTTQADEESAWGRTVRVRRPKSEAFSLPSELAARAAFFARLHRAADVDDWLKRVVQERIDLEEAAFAQMKRELVGE